MKKSLLLIFVFISQVCFAQNIVPNPSFEDTIKCPTVKNNISDATNWLSFGATPDYFNSCNTYPDSDFYFGCSVPSNWTGYQNAASGSGYAGLYNANIYINSAVDREYLGVHLTVTIVIGTKYYFSFKVSPAYKIPAPQFLSHECFSNNVGVKFSTVEFSYFNPTPTNNFSHWHYSNIISDTSLWIQLNGSFVSDSAYTYLIIGNFYDNLNSQIVCDSLLPYSASYLYLDDVCVSIDSATCNNTSAINSNSEVDFIKIFPNPARDCIAVEGREITSIEVFDIMGNIIIKQNVANSSLKTKVSLGTLSQGVYIMRINTRKNSILKKFIHI